MEQRHFEQCMKDIFSAHGKSAPTGNVVMAVWKRVKQLPDEFMTWAVFKFADAEKLPGNIGFEIERVMFPLWRTEFGKTAHVSACLDCDTATPGFFTAWQRLDNGTFHRFMVKCVCNTGASFESMPRTTREQAQQRGWRVMEGGHTNAFRFEQECLYAIGPQRDSAGYVRKAKNAGSDQRQTHLDAVAETDWWQ